MDKMKIRISLVMCSIIFSNIIAGDEGLQIKRNYSTSPTDDISNDPGINANVSVTTEGIGRTFHKMANHMHDHISNMSFHLLHGHKDEHNGGSNHEHHLDWDPFHHKNKTGHCGSNNMQMEHLWHLYGIPIFVIAPAVIIGVVILIKVIGLITAWIPSISGSFLKSFMHSSGNSDSGGYSGWSPPSSGYGAPPSTAYGSPPNLSRQTAVLEAIDNLSNMYGSSSPYYNKKQDYYSNPTNIAQAGSYLSDDATQSQIYPNPNEQGSSYQYSDQMNNYNQAYWGQQQRQQVGVGTDNNAATATNNNGINPYFQGAINSSIAG